MQYVIQSQVTARFRRIFSSRNGGQILVREARKSIDLVVMSVQGVHTHDRGLSNTQNKVLRIKNDQLQ